MLKSFYYFGLIRGVSKSSGIVVFYQTKLNSVWWKTIVDFNNNQEYIRDVKLL